MCVLTFLLGNPIDSGKFGEFPKTIHKMAEIWVIPENRNHRALFTKLISLLMDSNWAGLHVEEHGEARGSPLTDQNKVLDIS